MRPDLATLPRGETPNWVTKRQNGPPEWGARVGGGGIPPIFKNSTMKQFFKMLISHEDMYSLPSPYCSVKVCSSPFYML
jgi:hypothetical protein